MIRDGSRYPARLMDGSRPVDAIFNGSRPVWMSPDVQVQVLEMWLKSNVTTTVAMAIDADGHWFELEVVLPPSFAGNPTDGWSGEMVSGKPNITLGLFRSETLTTWSAAGEGWDFSPGRETPETMSNGWKKWFCRCAIPAWWINVMVDMSATSDRHGKSITEISVFNSVLPLNYPYTPTEIADGTLQADLRNSSLGNIPGATVNVTSGSLSATGKWHTVSGAKMLVVTMSGSNVTNVSYQGSTVSASYPYSMPSQLAALNAALTSSLGGDTNNRAVVLLHSDTWEIVLPDLVTTGMTRNMVVWFTPSDPNPVWNMYGEYQGMAANDLILGTPSNTRTPSGTPLLEALKAFARVGVIIP